MKRLPPSSINKDTLAKLANGGEGSSVLLARIELIKGKGMRQALQEIAGRDRIFPEMLPTQASLRWSVTRPALGTFDRRFWESPPIAPDSGEWWLQWDWEAVESRMFTAYSGDEGDLAMYQNGRDIHTETAMQLFGWTVLPDDWQGRQDRRRALAKGFRYAGYQYGRDERAILGLPGLEAIGLDRRDALLAARRLLSAHPKTVAFKQRVWAECVRTRQARTFLGHRRMLWGKPHDIAKEGLNHMIQGGVAGMMDWCLIAIAQAIPDMRLVLNLHDGAIIGFPRSQTPDMLFPVCRSLVERTWTIGDVEISFPAEWKCWDSNGARTPMAR